MKLEEMLTRQCRPSAQTVLNIKRCAGAYANNNRDIEAAVKALNIESPMGVNVANWSEGTIRAYLSELSKLDDKQLSRLTNNPTAAIEQLVDDYLKGVEAASKAVSV